MPMYRFVCDAGCAFDALFSMAEVPRETSCRRCSAVAKRAVTAPHLSVLGGSAARLIERTQRSAHEPATVDRLPARPAGARQAVSANPLHAKLPRP